MLRFTFPATRRIRKRAEYDRTFRKGRNAHTPHFRLVVAPAQTGLSRLGLVVSRKVGKAPQRNRVKRLLREFFRARQHDYAPPIDLVVVAKPGAAQLSWAELVEQLDGALERWRAE